MSPFVLLILLVPIAIALGWVFALVARRPVWAAYIFLATQPFVGGIDRGKLIPLLRPSEGIQLALTAAVLAGVAVRALRGEMLTVRITRLDRAVIALAAVSSIWPLFWMFARGQIPSSTDFFDTVVLWRLAGLYALFRWVLRTPDEVRRCLWVLVVSASMLAMLAILDSLGIWKPAGVWVSSMSDAVSPGRGGATLNSAIAVGDYLAYTLGVVLVWMLRHRRPRAALGAMAGLILLGILGTGQFSAWIEAGIVVLVVARSEGQLHRLTVWVLPLAGLGALVAWPVISTRLSGFGSSGTGGVPASWLGRYDNLTNFYLPMMGGFRWVLGVRPDSVLQAPETWRQVIYLESGYLWLFWVGGIPLFLTFLWFVRTGLRHTKRVMAERSDDIGVATVAARGAFWCLIVVSVIDPHITLRGGGDLFFCLLGLSANVNVPKPSPKPVEPMATLPELYAARRAGVP